MRSIVLLSSVSIALVGCPKLSKQTADAGPSAAVAADAATTPTSATGGRVINGVGDVPPWAPDKAGAKCTPATDLRAKLKAFEHGDDPGVSAGTADAAALQRNVGADTCFASRKALATALN